jgi:hypothetical protein
MSRLILLLSLCFIAAGVHAQNPITRCIGADGRPVFTDQPCGSLDATPAVAPSTAVSNPLQTVPILCAASRDELRQAVVDAFASRDANRLSGLVLWNGHGQSGAVAGIRQLNDLTQHTLLDFGDEPVDESSPGASELLVHTELAGDSRETHFGIVRQSGCLWLTPPD